MAKLNPYIRIRDAAQKGVGVHLTADEAWYLSQDSCIATVAQITDDGETSDSGSYFVTKSGFVDKEPSQ